MYKLLSHNDLDGVGCGILAKLAFNDKVKVRYNSITALDREIEFFLENDQQKTFLFITDLSPNKENEEKLHDYYLATGNVQLLDHHKTALHFNQYEWGKVLIEDEQGSLTSATSWTIRKNSRHFRICRVSKTIRYMGMGKEWEFPSAKIKCTVFSSVN